MAKNTPKSRAETTLFLLMSVDGKISSGESDTLDPDLDWKRIHGVKEGLAQYYRIEQTTDLHSLNTAKVMAKIGVNAREIPAERPKSSAFVSSIIVDRKPWLTAHGVRYLAQGAKTLYLATNNPAHPAHALESEIENLVVIHYAEEIAFLDLFQRMKHDYGAERITIQSGGTLNAVLVRHGLIDHLLLVVAPLLVGGQATPTLIGGRSFQTEADLLGSKALKLTKGEVLEDSYLRLEYDVIPDTIIDPK
ncbi:MAG: dihydrofolate reductase family protein [Planctomycetes bacterium]|nr:dihydrofolate reductase family protein [Planctomycetota bacterium]